MIALRQAIYDAVPKIRELIAEEQLNRDPKEMSPNEATAASVGNLFRSLGEIVDGVPKLS